MLTAQEQARYSRQTMLPEIGMAGQQKLKAAKVLVIGAGGLGCPVLQYLAAAGVGNIGIADGDVISISNLQRQVLYAEQETGLLKVDVARQKLQALNPHITINTYPFFADSSNIREWMEPYDIIVDGSDNFDTRYLLNDACVMLNKPMVSGAIYKFEGQVSVFNYKDGPTYRCIFPEPPAAEDSPNCADIGVVASLPGIIGTIQANEVIKMITGIGDVLSGKLLVIDTLTMNTHAFNFKLNPANKNIARLPESKQECAIQPRNINYEELQQMLYADRSIKLIDVREAEEHATVNIGGANIPLSVLANHYDILNKEDTYILYCASGMRSMKAANLLLLHGFSNVLNLKDGIRHLEAHL